MEEIDPKDDAPPEPQRREFLGKITGVVAGCGIVAASWPFISSMNPTRNVAAKSTTTVDLRGIEAGEVHVAEWLGKPVFVLHRSSQDIARMQNSPGDIEPEPDDHRVQRPEWLVVVGVCTHLGCVPTRNNDGWTCPCHGSRYDNSGRVVHGPAPHNLEVPPYRFVSADKIIIGKTGGGSSGA
jgi:ubiquinol-cytochrome c reductase iron-sulfur subunit